VASAPWPLSIKPSQDLIDVQDEIMGGELVISPVPCDPRIRVFSTPGFTPGSLPVLLPITGTTQSHSVVLIQTNLLIVSIRISFMVPLHLTLSLSPPIALLRRGPWVRVPAGSPP